MHGKYYLFTSSLDEKFKMTTISSNFIFQRAVKAWIIANCVVLITYVFEWVIFYHIEWFKNKIHLVRFFFAHPLSCLFFNTCLLSILLFNTCHLSSLLLNTCDLSCSLFNTFYLSSFLFNTRHLSSLLFKSFHLFSLLFNTSHLSSLLFNTCHLSHPIYAIFIVYYPFCPILLLSNAYHLATIQNIIFFCRLFNANYISGDLQVCPWANIQWKTVWTTKQNNQIKERKAVDYSVQYKNII
jgi:hypothetical protein